MTSSDPDSYEKSAQRARQRMRRRGENMKGDALWTVEEKQLLAENIGAGYSVVQKLLPRRTLRAIRGQAQAMHLRPERPAWLASDILLLRKIYPTASDLELRAAFPERTLSAIRHQGAHCGLRRKRKPYKKTGIPAIDELLKRCVEANIYMSDLDAICHSRRYFQEGRWRYQRPNYNLLVKAISFFEGQLAVRWPD